MADTNEVPIATAKGPGSPVIPLILAMVVVVGGSVGGGLYWLTKSGRLPVAGAPVVLAQAAKAEPPKTRMIQMEPMLVNLTDQGGASYLRVVMVLRVEDPPPAKDAKPKEEKPPEKGKPVVNEDEAALRDSALTVIGRETSVTLLEPEGKDQLKKELIAAFGTHVPTVKVTDVLFTEFLVQR